MKGVQNLIVSNIEFIQSNTTVPSQNITPSRDAHEHGRLEELPGSLARSSADPALIIKILSVVCVWKISAITENVTSCVSGSMG